jgi:hypothetical protein
LAQISGLPIMTAIALPCLKKRAMGIATK